MNDWTTWIIVAVAAFAFLLFKRLSLVSAAKAREALKAGALVIDVRSSPEFRDRHLPGAVNIPLDELSTGIPKAAPDKAQPILLHCLSGGRSGVARMTLKRMGYQNVFNLGSYSRARKFVGG